MGSLIEIPSKNLEKVILSEKMSVADVKKALLNDSTGKDYVFVNDVRYSLHRAGTDGRVGELLLAKGDYSHDGSSSGAGESSQYDSPLIADGKAAYALDLKNSDQAVAYLGGKNSSCKNGNGYSV